MMKYLSKTEIHIARKILWKQLPLEDIIYIRYQSNFQELAMSCSTNFLIKNLILEGGDSLRKKDTLNEKSKDISVEDECLANSSAKEKINYTSSYKHRHKSNAQDQFSDASCCGSYGYFLGNKDLGKKCNENNFRVKPCHIRFHHSAYKVPPFNTIPHREDVRACRYPLVHEYSSSCVGSVKQANDLYSYQRHSDINDQECCVSRNCVDKQNDLRWRVPINFLRNHSRLYPEAPRASKPEEIGKNDEHEDLAWIVNPRPFYKKEAKKTKRDSDPKRDRTTFTKDQRHELEKQFCQGRYPSRYQRADMARKLGLTEFQVKVWFQNRRMKFKRWNSAHMYFYNTPSLCYCPHNKDVFSYESPFDS